MIFVLLYVFCNMADPLSGVAVQNKQKRPHFEEEFFKSNLIFVLSPFFLYTKHNFYL